MKDISFDTHLCPYPFVKFLQFLYTAYIWQNKIQCSVSTNTAQLVERLDDDLEIVGSSPLYATSFPQMMFAYWHTSLQVETHNKND